MVIPSVANYLLLSLYDKGPIIEKRENFYKMGSQNRHLIKYFR